LTGIARSPHWANQVHDTLVVLLKLTSLEVFIDEKSPATTAWEQSLVPGISRNVLLLSVVSLFTDLSSEMVYPVVPLFLADTLGVPASIIGIIEGFAEATASIFKWVSGVLSDRLGRRKPFCLAGYGLAALTKPLLATAYSWPMVLCARVLDRFGKGLRGSPRDALIADSTPPELRGRAFGFHRSGDSIGAVGGPLLAVLLLFVLHGNYRTIFLIAFIPGLLSTFLILPVRDRVTPAVRRTFFSLAVARNNQSLRRFLLITLLFAVGNSSDMFLILRAKQLGAGSMTTILLFTFCNLLNVLSSFPAGNLSDRFGRKGILALGFFLFSGIYLAFGTVTSVWPLWILFGAYGVYLGLTDGVSKALVVDLAPSQQRGSALGLQAAIAGIAALPASMIAGMLWQKISPGAALMYGAVMSAIAGILMLLFNVKRGIPGPSTI
jgi:MFS family permease